jgi:hypothetical protein
VKHLSEYEQVILKILKRQSGNLGEPCRIVLWNGEVQTLLNTIANLRKANSEMIDTLEFYASEWRSDVYVGPTEKLLGDFGRRAREKLNESGD